MRPKTITLTGSGAGTTNSAPYRLNWRSEQTLLAFSTDGSTTGFTVQYTATSPDGYASASAWGTAATWYAAGTELTGITANAANVIEAPVQGVRLQADASGTDTGTLIVTQSSD
jgi:hypothetical protein